MAWGVWPRKRGVGLNKIEARRDCLLLACPKGVSKKIRVYGLVIPWAQDNEAQRKKVRGVEIQKYPFHIFNVFSTLSLTLKHVLTRVFLLHTGVGRASQAGLKPSPNASSQRPFSQSRISCSLNSILSPNQTKISKNPNYKFLLNSIVKLE